MRLPLTDTGVGKSESEDSSGSSEGVGRFRPFRTTPGMLRYSSVGLGGESLCFWSLGTSTGSCQLVSR